MAATFNCITFFTQFFSKGAVHQHMQCCCMLKLILQFNPSLKSLQQAQEYHAKFPKWYPFWFGPFHPIIRTSDLENIKLISQLPGGILVLFCNAWANYTDELSRVMWLRMISIIIDCVNHELEFHPVVLF